MLLLAALLGHILLSGAPYLSWKFITGRPEEIVAGGGVGPMLFNSIYILILSLAFALPVGLGAGIYLAVFAKKTKWTQAVRISAEALSSVPSIVFGLFGMLMFVQWMGMSFSILAGALTLSLLNLPVLVRVTEQSLRAVPEAYLEASLALGSSAWQAIRKVLIPASMPSLLTGITLVSGRALGESALLIYTSGLSVSRTVPDFHPLAMGETLSVHLWYVMAQSLVPDAQEIAAGSAALLMIMVLLFNLILAVPVRMLQRKLQGGNQHARKLPNNG
jgi:phosphate transport system permease protein